MQPLSDMYAAEFAAIYQKFDTNIVMSPHHWLLHHQYHEDLHLAKVRKLAV